MRKLKAFKTTHLGKKKKKYRPVSVLKKLLKLSILTMRNG